MNQPDQNRPSIKSQDFRFNNGFFGANSVRNHDQELHTVYASGRGKMTLVEQSQANGHTEPHAQAPDAQHYYQRESATHPEAYFKKDDHPVMVLTETNLKLVTENLPVSYNNQGAGGAGNPVETQNGPIVRNGVTYIQAANHPDLVQGVINQRGFMVNQQAYDDPYYHQQRESMYTESGVEETYEVKIGPTKTGEKLTITSNDRSAGQQYGGQQNPGAKALRESRGVISHKSNKDSSQLNMTFGGLNTSRMSGMELNRLAQGANPGLASHNDSRILEQQRVSQAAQRRKNYDRELAKSELNHDGAQSTASKDQDHDELYTVHAGGQGHISPNKRMMLVQDVQSPQFNGQVNVAASVSGQTFVNAQDAPLPPKSEINFVTGGFGSGNVDEIYTVHGGGGGHINPQARPFMAVNDMKNQIKDEEIKQLRESGHLLDETRSVKSGNRKGSVELEPAPRSEFIAQGQGCTPEQLEYMRQRAAYEKEQQMLLQAQFAAQQQQEQQQNQEVPIMEPEQDYEVALSDVGQGKGAYLHDGPELYTVHGGGPAHLGKNARPMMVLADQRNVDLLPGGVPNQSAGVATHQQDPRISHGYAQGGQIPQQAQLVAKSEIGGNQLTQTAGEVNDDIYTVHGAIPGHVEYSGRPKYDVQANIQRRQVQEQQQPPDAFPLPSEGAFKKKPAQNRPVARSVMAGQDQPQDNEFDVYTVHGGGNGYIQSNKRAPAVNAPVEIAPTNQNVGTDSVNSNPRKSEYTVENHIANAIPGAYADQQQQQSVAPPQQQRQSQKTQQSLMAPQARQTFKSVVQDTPGFNRMFEMANTFKAIPARGTQIQMHGGANQAGQVPQNVAQGAQTQTGTSTQVQATGATQTPIQYHSQTQGVQTQVQMKPAFVQAQTQPVISQEEYLKNQALLAKQEEQNRLLMEQLKKKEEEMAKITQQYKKQARIKEMAQKKEKQKLLRNYNNQITHLNAQVKTYKSYTKPLTAKEYAEKHVPHSFHVVPFMPKIPTELSIILSKLGVLNYPTTPPHVDLSLPKIRPHRRVFKSTGAKSIILYEEYYYGHWVENEMHGRGIYMNMRGGKDLDIFYEGEFCAGKKHGYGRMVMMLAGIVKQGRWEHGRFIGKSAKIADL